MLVTIPRIAHVLETLVLVLPLLRDHHAVLVHHAGRVPSQVPHVGLASAGHDHHPHHLQGGAVHGDYSDDDTSVETAVMMRLVLRLQ